jgi:hypothetical protein
MSIELGIKLTLEKIVHLDLLIYSFKIKIQQWKYYNKNIKIIILAMKVELF